MADDLLLTVMIAGDIVAELKAEMTRVADKYNIENVKRLHEIGGECKSTTRTVPLNAMVDEEK